MLPKLKALNESRQSLEDELNRAADIAGISIEWSSSTIRPNARQQGPARAEWTIRWLLEKLKSGDTKKEILLCPTAWKLLGRLIQAVPCTNAARLLNANQILTIVKEALEEAVFRFDNEGSENGRPSNPASSDHAAESESSTTIDDGRPSRKRKRDQTGSDVAEGTETDARSEYISVVKLDPQVCFIPCTSSGIICLSNL